MGEQNKMQKSDTIVLLLGAGFSQPHGLPVMKSFMGTARQRYWTLRERSLDSEFEKGLIGHYERMFQFQRECLRASWAFNRDWDNIEELYTQADLLRLAAVAEAGGEPKAIEKATTRCQAIAWAMWDVYRHALAHWNDARFPKKIIERFTEITGNGTVPAVVTTNYDVQLEVALKVLAERPENRETPKWACYYPGFDMPWACHDGETEPKRVLKQTLEYLPEPARKANVVPVIKLHGSVNWFQKITCGGQSVETIAANTIHGFEPEDSGANINGAVFDLPRFAEKELRWKPTEVSPAIIPPMLGKASASPVIAAQWNAAIHFLRKAARVIVVGYSFPETDTFMTRLLAAGLQENTGLEEFIICDIAEESLWKDRLDRIFNPTLRSTKVRYRQYDSARLLDTRGTMEKLIKPSR